MTPALYARLLRDPGLITLTLAAVLVIGAFLVGAGTPHLQMVACWTITPALDLGQFWLARQVCGLPGLPRYAHRF
ncbi:MAG TPA: hypothetical protein VN408_07250, partial [Actinoplanes sp.]|nr:hypothetical protein [Actinoplanes sp.]